MTIPARFTVSVRRVVGRGMNRASPDRGASIYPGGGRFTALGLRRPAADTPRLAAARRHRVTPSHAQVVWPPRGRTTWLVPDEHLLRTEDGARVDSVQRRTIRVPSVQHTSSPIAGNQIRLQRRAAILGGHRSVVHDGGPGMGNASSRPSDTFRHGEYSCWRRGRLGRRDRLANGLDNVRQEGREGGRGFRPGFHVGCADATEER